jgi:hypothetical protein
VRPNRKRRVAKKGPMLLLDRFLRPEIWDSGSPGVLLFSAGRRRQQTWGAPILGGSHPPGGRGEDHFRGDFPRGPDARSRIGVVNGGS